MSTDASTGPRRLGKYELRERLGRGGMAEVWKAYDPQLERYVAIKLLHADLQSDPEFIMRFSREARVIASLHHPNIVQIHDFQVSQPPESTHSTAYMIMDYVEGQTLANYIRTTSRIGKFPSPADVVHLFTSISRAIDYAHQHGMIHRDIKPANILLDQRHTKQNPLGEPILTDFGIAKLMGVATSTASGMWIGTPLYISPEQAQGHPGNERSDIYSLAVILYEICTGVQPFRGENISAVMMQHISAMPISPALINPNLPPALSMVILRGLAKNPADRFSSASALTASLAEALNMPIPSDMSTLVFPTEAMSAPTYLSPIRPNLPPGMMPASPSLPIAGSGQLLPSVSQSAPQLAASPSAGQSNPSTPVFNTPTGSSLANSVQNLPALMPTSSPSSATPAPISSPFAPRKQRRGLLFGLIPLIVILLLGSGVGAFYWLAHTQNVAVVPAKSIVGHAFFISSGQIYEHNNQGINDEVLMDLHNIADPSSGKGYYGLAWEITCHPRRRALSLSRR